MRTPVCAPAFLKQKEPAMPQRRRFQQSVSLKDRLTIFIHTMREQADFEPPGAKRDELLEKARKAETAVEIDGWANSRELQPPK
jgi:hypothetical protein